MKRYILIGIILLLLIGGGVFIFLLFGILNRDDPEKPPKVGLITPSASAWLTFTPTATTTVSPSPTASPTASPSATATLAARVAEARLIMPDVTLPASPTPFPDGFSILSEPPSPPEPLPDATLLPFPYDDFSGWVVFESDHPSMRYIEGNWSPLQSARVSGGQYHYTEDADAVVAFNFTGEALRLRYVGFTNGGIWQIVINGEVLDEIDSYAPSGLFAGTEVYYLGGGEHVLELVNTDRANPAISGQMIAFDAVQVYQADELTLIVPGGILPSATPTPTLIPARNIELVQAPPSPQPTATDIPIQLVQASLLVGYDENANGVLDVSEGVRGISVRLVEVGTNHVLAQGFTDARGFAELQASTNSPVLLVVPYFGQSWTVRSSAQQTFTLLLSPGNQPGLIP